LSGAHSAHDIGVGAKHERGVVGGLCDGVTKGAFHTRRGAALSEGGVSANAATVDVGGEGQTARDRREPDSAADGRDLTGYVDQLVPHGVPVRRAGHDDVSARAEQAPVLGQPCMESVERVAEAAARTGRAQRGQQEIDPPGESCGSAAATVPGRRSRTRTMPSTNTPRALVAVTLVRARRHHRRWPVSLVAFDGDAPELVLRPLEELVVGQLLAAQPTNFSGRLTGDPRPARPRLLSGSSTSSTPTRPHPTPSPTWRVSPAPACGPSRPRSPNTWA
jgi:hypothetical protein